LLAEGVGLLLTAVQVPTTLMAAVDASIGIKTAVNFHGKKNKLGTYWWV
jgi:3-dehydroquinate synthase